jgi:hypothetical protein
MLDPQRKKIAGGSLARPQGNVTGLTTLVPGFYQKYVELLREVVPSATRFALIAKPPPQGLGTRSRAPDARLE